MNSPIVERLSSSARTYQDQRELFDQLMEKSFPTADEITEIANILRETIHHFNDYSNEMEERIEKLRTKTLCHVPYSINDALSKLAMISTASKILAIIGGSLAIFGPDIPRVKWTGISLFAGAEALDVIASLYENKLQLASQEMSDLEKFNNEVIGNAKIFSLFIDKLNEIIRLDLENKERKMDKHCERIENLENKISECLDQYSRLPMTLQHTEVSCKIVSYFIQALPPEDPFNQAFNHLDPIVRQDDYGLLAEKKLTVSYLSETGDAPSTDLLNGSHQLSQRKWSLVEETPYPLKRSESVDLASLLHETPQSKFAHNVHSLITRFKKRFHLDDKIAVPHLYTPSGLRISSDPDEQPTLDTAKSLQRVISNPTLRAAPKDEKKTSSINDENRAVTQPLSDQIEDYLVFHIAHSTADLGIADFV